MKIRRSPSDPICRFCKKIEPDYLFKGPDVLICEECLSKGLLEKAYDFQIKTTEPPKTPPKKWIPTPSNKIPDDVA